MLNDRLKRQMTETKHNKQIIEMVNESIDGNDNGLLPDLIDGELDDLDFNVDK